MSHHDSSGTSSEDEGWISWFCGLNGNHVFCEVDRQFIEDSFNLFGLKQFVNKDYSRALNVILDKTDPENPESEEVTKLAALLYGLIHARFIISGAGLNLMRKKYLLRYFGECPRAHCNSQAVLPVGRSDEPGQGSYRLFCPNCQDVYNCHPTQRHIEGSNFGTTFAHMFFMVYEDLVPDAPSASDKYIPRIFGFKIHSSSTSIPKGNGTTPRCSDNDSNANAILPTTLSPSTCSLTSSDKPCTSDIKKVYEILERSNNATINSCWELLKTVARSRSSCSSLGTATSAGVGYGAVVGSQASSVLAPPALAPAADSTHSKPDPVLSTRNTMGDEFLLERESEQPEQKKSRKY